MVKYSVRAAQNRREGCCIGERFLPSYNGTGRKPHRRGSTVMASLDSSFDPGHRRTDDFCSGLSHWQGRREGARRWQLRPLQPRGVPQIRATNKWSLASLDTTCKPCRHRSRSARAVYFHRSAGGWEGGSLAVPSQTTTARGATASPGSDSAGQPRFGLRAGHRHRRRQRGSLPSQC
jgi:hypothetical protein